MEVMKSVDLQPLQYLAAVRVAISVCESEDMQYMLRRFHKTNGNDGTAVFLDGQWKRLRGKAKRKLNQIGVPDLIIDIILENLWPISFEISKWILYHVEDTGIDCSSNFCWTPHVNIDYVKTADILIKTEAIEIKNRFRLACFYCLDSELRSLWEQMSLSEKTSFYVQENLKKSDQNPIVIYWIHYIQGKRIKDRKKEALESFKYAVKNGYLSATKFFFGKLKLQLRTRMILNSFYNYLPPIYKPQCIVKDQLAIACFLNVQLRSDYERISDFDWVFLYFLEWPMQKHFITIVNGMMHQWRPYFWGRTIGYLLEGIIEKDIRGFKDHNYKELFKEFWHQCPGEIKTYASSEYSVGFKIFMKFAEKHFRFVFEENSFDLKAKFRAIIFQQENSEDVTEIENVDFFKFLVRERVTTKTTIYRFSLLPLGELIFLIDGILGVRPIPP